MLRVVAILGVLCHGGAAAAEGLDWGVGAEGAAILAGDVQLGGGGLRLELENPVSERWRLCGEYSLLGVTADHHEPRDLGGVAQRVGLTARWQAASFRVTGEKSHIRHWIEAGVGYEVLPWYDGETLARRDAIAGFRVTFDETRRGWGFWIEGRAMFSQPAPEPAPAAALRPVPPPREQDDRWPDASLVVSMGFRWAR